MNEHGNNFRFCCIFANKECNLSQAHQTSLDNVVMTVFSKGDDFGADELNAQINS